MIINEDDIRELDEYLDLFRQWEADDCRGWMETPSIRFFANRPHLLLPLGFDESRPIVSPEEFDFFDPEEDGVGWMLDALGEPSSAEELCGISSIDFTFGVEYLYRWLSSGAWYWFEGLDSDRLVFHGPPADSKRVISVDEMCNSLHKLAKSPDSTPRTLWLPSIWTPRFQQDTRLFLTRQVSTLLQEVYKEGKELREIPPHQLEEMIAELLRAQGMEIHITPKTRDGGRDVIARGELVPGEPMVLAVEVKQKAVVGIDDLYKGLKANEDYPALLLATAGRFSAGIVREKKRRRNELRLMLKDGVALSQWINMYGAKHSK